MERACVHLSLNDVRWQMNAFQVVRDVLVDEVEDRNCVLTDIEEYVFNQWGRMGVTDWLIQWTREANRDCWIRDVSQLVHADNAPWQNLLDKTDVFAVILGMLVDEEVDKQALGELLEQLYNCAANNIAREVRELYWPFEWPADEAAEPDDFVKAAKTFRELRRANPERFVYGALASGLNDPCERDRGLGVLRVGVHLRESRNGQWALSVLPWSRYVPDTDTLEQQSQAVNAAVIQLRESASDFSSLGPHEVLLNLQPTGTNDHRAVSHGRRFSGDSLGLAIMLALSATVHRRHIEAWATGRLRGADIANVDFVPDKARALGHFLHDQDNRRREEAEITLDRFRVFVPPGWNPNDIQMGLRGAGFNPPQNLIVEISSVTDLVQPAALFDPFHLERRMCKDFFERYGVLPDPPRAEHDDHRDADFWYTLVDVEKMEEAGESETLGGIIARRWIGWDRHPPEKHGEGEVLACIPFHAHQDDAAQLLRHSAAKLTAYFAWRRALQQNGIPGVQEDGVPATLFPVPLVLDIRKWQRREDRCPLAEFLLDPLEPPDICPGIKELYVGIREHHIAEALSQKHRFCFIVIYTDIDGIRKLDDGAAERVIEVFKVLLGKDTSSGVAPQCFILLAPDIHVQLFWEETLEKLGLKFDQETILATHR